jgi:hypothetical protein
MPRLSFHQLHTLVHYAKFNHGRGAELRKSRGTTMFALREKGLIEFVDARGTFVPTARGEKALDEHGYEANGEWRGSNQPRKYG